MGRTEATVRVAGVGLVTGRIVCWLGSHTVEIDVDGKRYLGRPVEATASRPAEAVSR